MPEQNRKVFTPVLTLKADAPGALGVEFATLNVIDLDKDVTVPGAFGEQGVRIQGFSHNTGDWSIGKGTIRESADKAVMDGLINLDMIEGKEAYASLKFDLEHGDPLQEWSYVYQILDADFGEFQGQQVRFLKRLKVYSVDPVFLGAGIGTRTTGVKSVLSFLEHLNAAESDAEILLERIRARADTREKEGRQFSAANVERILTIAGSQIAAGLALREMVASSEPKEKLILEKLRYERNRTMQLLGAIGG